MISFESKYCYNNIHIINIKFKDYNLKLMNKIYHIDCTLRDGGYYNLWNFEESLVRKYLEVMEKLNIDFVELGLDFEGYFKFGLYASTTEKHLSKLKNLKKLKLATMINIGE